MLGYLCVLLIVKAVVVHLCSCMLGYLCKAVVVLLSWDVRLPLSIVDCQSCSSTALVRDIRLTFVYC